MVDASLLSALATGCASSATPPTVECPGGGACASGQGADGGDAGGETSGGDAGEDLPDTDHCGGIDDFGTSYDDTIARWVSQDQLDPPPEQLLVFTGSSSIRRWEGLAGSYTDYAPLQRGFGGAQVAEVAVWAEELVTRHDPAGVVVFAGTNDVAFGVDAETVVARFRCLRARIWTAHGQALPVLFIGITPTPSRWEQWETADAVNDTVEALALQDPGLVYVDVPSAFLATGSPPDEALFVADMLHLSDEGYGLWDSVLRPAVESALSPKPTAIEQLNVYCARELPDPETIAMLHKIMPDEKFHMAYPLHELEQRRKQGEGERVDTALRRVKWNRLKEGWLRFSRDIGHVMSSLWLFLLYAILIPPFSLLGKVERGGWQAPRSDRRPLAVAARSQG